MRKEQQDVEEPTVAENPAMSSKEEAKAEDLTGDALRVTPEEVALAIAALEAKRDAEHAWRDGTLTLDEVIHQLGLNTTQQELAREVVSLRADRKARAVKEQTEKLNRASTWFCLGLPMIGIAALLLFALVTISRQLVRHHAVRESLRPMASLPIQKLSLIPDNVPVHIDADTLIKLAEGEATSNSVSVDTRGESGESPQAQGMFNNEWTLVKSNGEFFVRGWATAEFALNIRNNATGAIFSSLPRWLPANKLVAVVVPVYRLEKQQVERYDSDGTSATSASSSVSMAVTVVDSNTAVQDIVLHDVLPSDDNFLAYSAKGWSHVVVSARDGVVHIKGNATTADLKRRAGQIAAATIHRMHVPYTVSNELEIAQSDE